MSKIVTVAAIATLTLDETDAAHDFINEKSAQLVRDALNDQDMSIADFDSVTWVVEVKDGK